MSVPKHQEKADDKIIKPAFKYQHVEGHLIMPRHGPAKDVH
jgi:hypothetical protein